MSPDTLNPVAVNTFELVQIDFLQKLLFCLCNIDEYGLMN